MSEHEFDPAELVRALVDARVDFVVIGGYAAIRHREVARFTEDLDVIAAPERDNLERLAVALQGLDALSTRPMPGQLPVTPGARELSFGGTWELATRFGALHIVQNPPGAPPYEALASDAELIEAFGRRFAVCSREHLVAMKRAVLRRIDIEDLRALGEDVEGEG